jgi:hypothetical protein
MEQHNRNNVLWSGVWDPALLKCSSIDAKCYIGLGTGRFVPNKERLIHKAQGAK